MKKGNHVSGNTLKKTNHFQEGEKLLQGLKGNIDSKEISFKHTDIHKQHKFRL